MDSSGHSEVFFINKQNHAFDMHDAGGVHQLSGAYTVQSLSAGVDSAGHADAFVTAGDNSIWEWNSSGWHKLYEPEHMTQFAAVKGDRAYAVGADGALYEYSPPYTIYLPPYGIPIHLGGWQRLDGPGAVQSIDAVTDAKGYDAVFAIRGDGSFQELYQGGWHWLSGATTIHKGFSAGTDLSGHADVYGVAGDNSFWKWDNGWARLANAGVVSQFSATNNGQCWYLAPGGSLNKFDGNNSVHNVWNGSFTQVSAAASNDVYVVNWDKTLWERTGGGVWHQIN